MTRTCLLLLVALLLTVAVQAQPAAMVDDMEDLSGWQTGGQKEATLLPERALVKEGKQALRFEVRIDHQADESIADQKYPKGWPRIERNPKPALDLSPYGGLSFDVYTESSRPAMPGSSLHVILRDQSGSNWSANLGELPLKRWKHFRLDFPASFARSAIVHWQFFLSESDYNHGDLAAFIIDNVQGYAARHCATLLPQIETALARLRALAGPSLDARWPREVAGLREQTAGVDRLDLAGSNALDAKCLEVLAGLRTALLQVGAQKTSSDGSYCVGTETSVRKIMRDDVAFTPGADLKLSVAGNERESGQILVRAMTRDIPRLDAQWTDLTGPGGAKLPREKVSVQAVGYVEVLKANYPRDRDGWWPDPLLPLDWPGSGKQGLGPLSGSFAKVGETQPLWMTVSCPTGQKPGLYTGTITLKPEGLPESKVRISIQVRSFSLPLRPRLKTAFAYFESEYRSYYKRPPTMEQRRETEQFLLDHKLNPMNLYTPFAWPPPEDVKFMAQRGLNAHCLGYCPATVKAFGEQAYYYYLSDNLNWLRSQGLDGDAWLYGYDEPHCRPDWEELKGVMRDVYALVDMVAPDLPKASTTAIVPDLFGVVNLWIPQTMQVVRRDTLARQKAGDQVWTYVACTPPHPFANYFIEYPALDQRVLGWQTWQEQCTGFLYYATNLWRPNWDGTDQRWPDVPWNPRPAKDFAFNGDGLLIYPHPDGSPLSTVRLEAICDGFEDYDYLCLLRDAAAVLKAAGKKPELVKQAQAATAVPEEVSRTLTEFNQDPAALLAQREKVAGLLEQVKAALGEAAWAKVLKTEARLNPKQDELGEFELAKDLPYEGKIGQLMAWWVTDEKSAADPGWVKAPERDGKQVAQSRGTGKGWSDWQSLPLRVKAPQQLAVRFAVKGQVKQGLIRVLLCKYGANGMPLDTPTRQQGAFAPAVLGTVTASDEWEKHRYLVSIPAGVKTVRLRLQAYGLEGTVSWDEVSVTPHVADPNQIDDMDELGSWRTGFPESTVARETKTVHQGDAALRYTVRVNHKGGEEKYPIGWPSLTWTPSPALDWTGKQALTFWVYATSTRDKLPERALNFSLRSKPGEQITAPLTLPLNQWHQVRVPLAGKELGAVNYLHFYVEEAAYNDRDEVSFVLDDMRVE